MQGRQDLLGLLALEQPVPLALLDPQVLQVLVELLGHLGLAVPQVLRGLLVLADLQAQREQAQLGHRVLLAAQGLLAQLAQADQVAPLVLV